jgi:hypothetical protein
MQASQELVSLPAASKKGQEAEESSAVFEDVPIGEADDDSKKETENTQKEEVHNPWSTRFVASVPTRRTNKQETNFENLSKVSGLKLFGKQQPVPDRCAVQHQSLENMMDKKSPRGRFGGLGRLFGNQQHHQVGDTESESSSDADEDDSLKETTKSDPITVPSEESTAMEGRVGRWGNAFRNYARTPHEVPIGKDMDQSNDNDYTDEDSESTTSHDSSCTLESVDLSELLEENGGDTNATANRPWTRLWRAQEFTSNSSPTVHFI